MRLLIKLFSLFFLSVRLCLNVSGQQNELKYISDQFNNYNQNALTEKIYAHTDKSFYLVGEIIWFKLYYVDGNLHQSLDLSKVAYVDIIDKTGKGVLQAKIELSNGSGDGSFYLPVSIASGVYKLRTYTNWMKNFSADYYFEKTITIVNSLKSLSIETSVSPVYDIQFFPEGGNLVQGIESKTAFRIVDQSGKGVDCKGAIIDKNNDTVTRFQPEKFGIGNFKLTPSPGNEYKAIVKVAGRTIIKPLPAAYEQGYVMNISERDVSRLQLKINCNIQSTEAVYLVVHTRQSLKIAERIPLINGTGELTIDKSKMGEGISHLTIFNSARQPVCERLYFIRPLHKLTIESASTGMQFDSRKKVDIDVMSKDEMGKAVSANMSVSVYKVDQLQGLETIDISSYFWLTSDLKGDIESPNYYFTEAGIKAADNLMLTHGWRRFAWQNIARSAKPIIEFLPEVEGHIINGKIINAKTGKPAVDVLTYLSVPGARLQLYGSQSNSHGDIRFYTKNFIGSNEVILQADNRVDTSYGLELSNPFSEKVSSSTIPAFQLSDNTKNALLDNSIVSQVQNAYSGEKLKQLYAPGIDSTAFFGRPDSQYLLDNYVRFTTMEEVLREYVHEVLVRRQKEKFRLMISDNVNHILMEDPMILLNGVPVFETDKIMQYDPLKIRKLEVMNKEYYFGPLILKGMMNFTTYRPDPAMLVDKNSVVIDYEGLQLQREFYSPVYETESQLTGRMPDFRNVLYWSPAINSDSQGKARISFYTSDQKGKYLVVFQGMTSTGNTGENSFSLEVK